VEENLATCSDPVSLTAADAEAIRVHLLRLKKMADLYCTGCGYCMPCPAEVNIPSIFAKFNQARVWGLWDHARKAYGNLGKTEWDKGKHGDACTECGQCEEKCPQKLPIRKQLKEAHEGLK
jgi:predicted aldo/keto reductase-like oxidoreductase